MLFEVVITLLKRGRRQCLLRETGTTDDVSAVSSLMKTEDITGIYYPVKQYKTL